VGQVNQPEAAASNAAPATPPDGETATSGAAAARTARLRRKPETAAAPVETKSFEAPHRMEKETRLTHLAGLTALSFWRTSSWLAGHLPAGFVYRVGGALSMIGYAFSFQRRRWLRANFGHVLGVPPSHKEAHRVARAAYRNYSRYVLELMRLPWLKRAELDQLVEAHGYDEFLEVFRNSRGVILVAAHLGNNEAAAAGFADHGLPINVVGDDSSYRELYELFERQRESWGIKKMIPWRNLRGIYSALKSKEGLVLLVDWGYRPDGIPVKMFDCWTTLPAGPAQLAAKFGSTIVPFCVNRLPDGRFRISGDKPIRVASDSPADLAVATQAIATALEGHIAPAPEQWYIFKPIWPDTEAEQARLEQRNRAAMANDAAGASANGNGNGRAARTAEARPDQADTARPSTESGQARLAGD
jgi:KDO2-lipid IV(A) lauroyltransferase